MYDSAPDKRLPFHLKFKTWFVGNPVLIYTMGKVGSSSLSVSLDSLGVENVKPHSLTFVRKGSYFVVPDQNISMKMSSFARSLAIHLKTKLFMLSKSARGEKVKVITLVRDPIARNISAFFEQMQYVSAIPPESLPLGDIGALFWKFAFHDAPIVWFDREIQVVTGIDVYSASFDGKKGYSLLSNESAEVLTLRTDRLAELESVIAEFVGEPEFKLVNSNIGARKPYSSAYSRFVSELEFPEDYVERLLKSPKVRHFFTDQELLELREKWLRSSTHS